MKDKIIIMPNGDGRLASTITAVTHSFATSDPVLGQDFPAMVMVGLACALIDYPLDSNELAYAERDRILSEWQAWLEGRTVKYLTPPKH